MAETDPGLCRACAHARTVVSAKGATFWLCRLGAADPSWPKYPPLPVLSCAGYRPLSERQPAPEPSPTAAMDLARAMAELPTPDPWPLVASRPGPDLHIFRARLDDRRHPGSGQIFERVALEATDWVNVIALSPAREVLLVRQFRFGTGEVSTEIPAGMVDEGERHADAARRELREETGYESERWTYLGGVAPNPAFLGNRCHHWLAEGCVKVGEPEMDGGEDIALVLWPLERVLAAIDAGLIDHSLVVTAFSRLAARGWASGDRLVGSGEWGQASGEI